MKKRTEEVIMLMAAFFYSAIFTISLVEVFTEIFEIVKGE